MHSKIRLAFEKMVGCSNIITQDLNNYNRDWMNKYVGQSQLVLTPQTSEHVSQILKYCNQNQLKVVPQSGNTGLVGGSVPINDEIVISMRKMNKIYEFDQNSAIITSESGVILQNLNDYLFEYKYQMPWDLGARGSCLLGGNISTNAGGLNVVKHGLLRNYIMGLEVVLPNGKILNLMNKNRKDNTGTDLKQLFIGSEGTLGIITKANVLCIPIPQEKKVFFLELQSFQDVIKVLQKVKKNEQVLAFEFMEGRILKKNKNRHSQNTLPFQFDDNKYYVLIEIAGQQLNVDQFSIEMMEFTQEIIINQNEKEAQFLWKLREEIAESMGKMGYVLKYDVSIPPDKFEWLVNQVYPQREGPFHVYYGHVGDGNVHINIVFESLEHLHKEEDKIELKLFGLVKSLGGSISAEHGIGQHKRKYMELQKGKDVLECLYSIKKLFDPNSIMNPNKLL
ncbi:unnamed protein product [Paramecium sonneborni]|uniref:FAD-binding PCMH-type domain-containing protein n=1 Tax=Paramecium sonneborni TaxID=65129 RepID=A0A8S1RGL8_9CILI|nr:unnamed protein product [Paramecium sonneborni]